MSKFLATLGSIAFGISIGSYTHNLVMLAFAVVSGWIAWKLFIDALKMKDDGSDSMDR